MSEIIASTYELVGKIGSGGGGVIYLANHMRLGKKVALKADKRKLATSPEALSREVDSLKHLSHTYIPQVFDFFLDGDTVYTVVDYIEGESLDKPLKNGMKFTQPQVIKWARELLEALSYLHRPIHGSPPRGIVHSDIKPSNIMLTPHGDIRLIDFNIALALGEERVAGRSDGYSSPEHYSQDTSFRKEATAESDPALSANDDETLTLLHAATGPLSSPGKKVDVPDVRSDIYSVGATLYHLLSGRKPAKDTLEAIPLSEKEFSPQIVKIISKAMSQNPDHRYQTADEMLSAFEHLRENDSRFHAIKRTRIIASIVLTLMFLIGGVFAFVGWRQLEQLESMAQHAEILVQLDEEKNRRNDAERQHRLEEMRVLAANSADALRSGDRLGAIALALSAVPGESDVGIPHAAEAIKALTDALGVYDLSDGFRPFRTVTLPSETLNLVIAPDGSSFAAMSFGKLSVFDTDSGKLLTQLPAIESGHANALYIDSSTIIYAASDGLQLFDLRSESAVWTGTEATTITVSADGDTIAAVNRDGSGAIVYSVDGDSLADISFGGRRKRDAANDRFGNPGGYLFELNHDGSLLAVSFSDGGLGIFDITGGLGFIELINVSDYAFFEGGFYSKYFAFSATSNEVSLFAVVDMERLAITISTSLPGRIRVFADESGVYMSYNETNVLIDPETARQTLLGYDPRDQAAGGFRVDGSLNSPLIRISRYESHADKEIFRYDPGYNYDEARLNYRGDRVMLFSFNRFRIFDIGGRLINETSIPSAGQVYDQQYRRHDGGSCLEVIYFDGTVHKYSGDDGTLFDINKISPPDPSLFEEFSTDDLLITSPLHGTPVAQDILTGAVIRELERDAYLTYVTQVGEFVITEYISAYGDRFGLLLDGRTCETLAHIPELSDIIGDRLIINIRRSGSLRETRLFSTEELIEMARAELGRG